MKKSGILPAGGLILSIKPVISARDVISQAFMDSYQCRV
jgi:hypothetical protein